MPDQEALAKLAIDAGFKLHPDIGPGLRETACAMILTAKRSVLGLEVSRQVPLDIKDDGILVKEAYRLDLLIEHCLIIGVKAQVQTLRVYAKQVLTYLKFTGLTPGFIMNFGMGTFKDGLRRLVRDHPPSFASSRLCANFPDGASA